MNISGNWQVDKSIFNVLMIDDSMRVYCSDNEWITKLQIQLFHYVSM